MINREQFYSVGRELGVLPKTLSQAQVDSIDGILDYAESKTQNKQYIAYMLATTKHETGNTFLPIEELGSNKYLSKYYWNITLRKWLGNLGLSDSWLYKGRGYVMITGRGIYRRVGLLINVDLEKYPEKATEPKVAAKILVDGLLNGWFTGKKLSHYVDESGNLNPKEARRTVNGTDKADTIAGYYNKFMMFV